MDRRTLRGCTTLALGALLMGLAACSTSVTPAPSAAAAPTNFNAWTTPPPAGSTYAAARAQAGALQPAPRAVVGAPLAAQQPRLERYPSGMLPPPPPPPDSSLPVVGAPTGAYAVNGWDANGQPIGAPSVQAAPATQASASRGAWVTPERTYTCGLPCADGISMWHVRGVLGLATFHGDDAGENCIYYGVDVGRTFCGCWGLDAYYRYNSGQFRREPAPGLGFDDGGQWHHIGAKLTYAKSLGNSPFYVWGGAGGGYFWTEQYIANDSGPEVFLEAGVGFNLGRNWAIRAGLNAHVMDTSVTRRLPANDGQSRILWVLAPVIELEGRF